MKRVLVIVLAVLNTALLTVIIISAATGWRFSFFGAKPGGNVTPQPVTAASVPATAAPSTQPQTEKPTAAESTAAPTQEQTSQATTAPVTQPVTQKPTQAPTQKPTQAPATEPTSPYPDPNSVSTKETASSREAELYTWNNGWSDMSSNAELIGDFTALTGGWKALIVTDPFELMDAYTTDFVNISISGSASDVKITMSWGTRLYNSTGKTVQTNSTPSSFSGKFQKGAIDAVGSGRLVIKDFYCGNGKEYAVGEYTWPDGLVGYVGLTRP